MRTAVQLAGATIVSAILGGGALAQDVVKVGFLPQVHDAANFAVEQALREKYNVEYVQFLRYTDVEVALSRGDIDMSSTGYSTAIASAMRGGEPKFVFVSGMSRGAVNLVCRNDVEIGDWPDLKGHVFGVLTGGTAQIFFDDALATHGLKLNDVERVSFTAPGPPLLQAMESGQIECMAAYEPFTAKSVADGHGYYPPTDLADNNFLGINGAFAVNVDFLAEHPEVVQDAVDALVAATEKYNGDKQAWVNDVAPRINFEPEVISVAVDHVTLDTNLYRARTHKLAEVMSELGFIRGAPDAATLDAYFNYDFITKATGMTPEELGRDK